MILNGCSKSAEDTRIKVLILSGKNNHEWQKTTPLLEKIYRDAKLFSVATTDLPDTLKYDNLKQFDVIVSNWNTWPDNNFRFTEKWEKDFLKYVKKEAELFLSMPELHHSTAGMSIIRLGLADGEKRQNMVNKPKAKISGFDHNHPVTKGLKDFFIVDEIWEKTDIWPGAQPLASVSSTDKKDGHQINENAVFVNQTGKGRSFFTTLGHNERALLNSGLQTLILRATQWVSQKRCDNKTACRNDRQRSLF